MMFPSLDKKKYSVVVVIKEDTKDWDTLSSGGKGDNLGSNSYLFKRVWDSPF